MSVEPRNRELVLQELREKCDVLWQTKLTRLAPESPMIALWEEHIAIREELEAICKLQSELVSEKPKKDDRQVCLDGFMKWCDRMQISAKGVGVVFSEEIGFELQTTQEVKSGVDMVSVPRNALFSWDQARKSALLKKAFERDVIVRSMDNVALALMLCCQKLLPDSYWHPYFDILPETFDTPLYYTLDEIQSLRPSPVFEESLLLYRNVTRQFLYFLLESFSAMDFRNAKKRQQMRMQEPIYLNAPMTPENFTFDLYRWSVACVSTRVNMIPSQDLRDDSGHPLMIPCLIPLLDMANHEVDIQSLPPSVYFSIENDCASITAVRDYKPMEIIRIYYGKRSSADFLLHNGFVPANENAVDSCKLKIGFPKRNELYEARLKMMQDYGYTNTSNIFYFEISASEPHFEESLSYFARVFVLEKPGDGQKTQLAEPSVVLKAFEFLKKRFELTIHSYGDLEKVEPKTRREETILKLKQNEVKIYEKAVRFCGAQMQELIVEKN